MKPPPCLWFPALIAFSLASLLSVPAQVNSGSDVSDGAFNPTSTTTKTVINMADRPDGIYHDTSVNIPAGVTGSFLPNANHSLPK